MPLQLQQHEKIQMQEIINQLTQLYSQQYANGDISAEQAKTASFIGYFYPLWLIGEVTEDSLFQLREDEEIGVEVLESAMNHEIPNQLNLEQFKNQLIQLIEDSIERYQPHTEMKM